jgi:hypothetical protein
MVPLSRAEMRTNAEKKDRRADGVDDRQQRDNRRTHP